MNITIDDTSPRIQYYSAPNAKPPSSWFASSGQMDPGISRYFKSTFTLTTGDGDRMVLTFNGSEIWVFGAKNFNHGWYSAKIDDFASERFTDNSPVNRTYQNVLYHRDGLDVAKEHTVTLTNIPSDTRRQQKLECYLDIDYIIIQQPIADVKVYTTELDDGHHQFQYSGSWTAEVHDSGYRGHISVGKGDTMTLPFNGSSIEVFGTLNRDHGNYTVAMDGINKGEFNGSFPRPAFGGSLFSASGLDDGLHTIVMTNLGGANSNFLDIDRVTINSTISPSSSADNTLVTSSRQDNPFPTSPPSGRIARVEPAYVAGVAGGVTGGFLALVLIGVISWLIWRKKRRERDESRRAASQIDLTGEEVKPYQEDSPARLEEVRSAYFSAGADRGAEQVRSEYFTLGPPSINQGTEYAPGPATPTGGYHPSQLSLVTTRDGPAPISAPTLLPGIPRPLHPVDSKSTLSVSAVGPPSSNLTVVNSSDALMPGDTGRYGRDHVQGAAESSMGDHEIGSREGGPPAYDLTMAR